MAKFPSTKHRLPLLLLGCFLGLGVVELVAKTVYLGASVRTLAKERESFLGREGALAGGLREQGHFERSLALHPFWGYGARPGKLAVNRFGFFSSKELILCGDRLCLQGAQPNDLVVGVFGGSLALQVASDEAALEAGLAPLFPGRRVRVVNFALPGHSAPQTLAVYQYFRHVPGLVILLDGLNEIWNPARNNELGYPPVFAKAEHFRLLSGEAEGSRRDIERLRRRIQGATERSLWPVWNRLHLAHAIWELERSYLLRRIGELGAGAGESRPFFDAGPAQLSSLGLAEWVFTHETASHLAERQGAGFFHFLQPTPFSSGKILTEAERATIEANAYLSGLVRQAYPQLRQRARSLRVSDLGAAFDNDGGSIWIDAAHVNETGIRRLREGIVETISALARPRNQKAIRRSAR